jgi:hypothetical protein
MPRFRKQRPSGSSALPSDATPGPPGVVASAQYCCSVAPDSRRSAPTGRSARPSTAMREAAVRAFSFGCLRPVPDFHVSRKLPFNGWIAVARDRLFNSDPKADRLEVLDAGQSHSARIHECHSCQSAARPAEGDEPILEFQGNADRVIDAMPCIAWRSAAMMSTGSQVRCLVRTGSMTK